MNLLVVATRCSIVTVAFLALFGCRNEAARTERQPTTTLAVRSSPVDVEPAPQPLPQPDRAPPLERSTAAAPPYAGAEIDQSLVGRTVHVQFRRDALGMGANVAIEPTAEQAGPRTITLNG